MFRRCSECNSFGNVIKCLRTGNAICRTCCDVDCPDNYSCWGRYY